MTRLTKLVETWANGEKTRRIAYVLMQKTLPKPHDGFEWREEISFSAADEFWQTVG